MGPTFTAVQQATRLFDDPGVRTRVRTWFDEGVPLLEMVDRLGFSRLVDDGLRAAIEGLSTEEVAIIRGAYLAEIERAGDAVGATPPVECTLTAVAGPVRVTADDIDGRRVARVDAGSEAS